MTELGFEDRATNVVLGLKEFVCDLVELTELGFEGRESYECSAGTERVLCVTQL